VDLLLLKLCRDGNLHRGDIMETMANSIPSRVKGKLMVISSVPETWLDATSPLTKELFSLKTGLPLVGGVLLPDLI
jgi:hypothetical protein